MQKYKEYRDSGIEWIEEIPKDWKITKIKKVANYKIGGTPPRKKMEYFEGDNLWVSIRDLNQGEIILDTKEKITLEGINDSNCKLIPKGSLLYSFKLSVGLVAFAGVDLYTNEAIASFFPGSEIQLKYLRYALTVGFENNARENIYSAKLFNQRSIDNAKIVFPSEQEQIDIANFLEYKTNMINNLIDKKIDQIKKLKEFEKTLIDNIFKTGLNNKFKESGIEWIGKIPFNWKIKKLKKLLLPKNGIKIGPFGSQLKIEIMKPSGYKVYGQENVIYNDFALGDNYIDESKFKELQQCEIVTGDIVIAMMGTIGNTHLVPEGIEKGIMNSHLLRLRTNKELITSKFLSLGLNKAHYLIQNIIRNSKGAIMQGLNSEIIKDLLIVLPPIDEQNQIIKYLDEKTSKIQESIKLIKLQISKLQEYKKILINNAVTGKIKVSA